jgi:hypothetical protein
MPAIHKQSVVLAAGIAWLVASACASKSTSDDPDETPGSVLGGSGGATGGSGTGGNFGQSAAGGSLNPGKGGSGTTGGSGGDSGGTGGSGGDTGGVGGSGGTGGDMGTGGNNTGGSTGGTGGAGGSAGATPGAGTIGSACASDADCASDLTCVTDTGGMLGGASPGGGLCTIPCNSDTECTALLRGSWCVAFDEGATIAYCLEGCTSGSAGVPKCHERTDFACSLIGLLPNETTCETSDDCALTELCATTADPPVCGEIVTGCVPNCGGDYDCAAGEFCDYGSGLCVPQAPDGQAIGTFCDPGASTDPCNGFCIATTEAGDEGVCSAFCTLAESLYGCGWNGSSTAEAGCLFGTRLTDQPAPGDVGLCGALCDCNDDCAAPSDYCVDETGGDVMIIWDRAGYCRPLQEGETESDTISACP